VDARHTLEQRQANGDMGGTIAARAYEAVLGARQPVSENLWRRREHHERHRHRYEVNINTRMPRGGGPALLRMSRTASCGDVEIPRASLVRGRAVPPGAQVEALRAHPLFTDFIRAARDQSRLV